MNNRKSNAVDRHMPQIQAAFLKHGYDQLTMSGIAKSCDLTRRALYNHFSGKDEAFREVMVWQHEREIRDGLAAGEEIVEEGGSALDALVAVIDVRYGTTRRNVHASPHQHELNTIAFLRCRDVMIESAIIFQSRLAEFFDMLGERGMLVLRRGTSPEAAAQLIADGARGVNQALPPLPIEDLPKRYRTMIAALLYGLAENAALVSQHERPRLKDAHG